MTSTEHATDEHTIACHTVDVVNRAIATTATYLIGQGATAEMAAHVATSHILDKMATECPGAFGAYVRAQSFLGAL